MQERGNKAGGTASQPSSDTEDCQGSQQRVGRQNELTDERTSPWITGDNHPRETDHLGQKRKTRIDVVLQEINASCLKPFLRTLQMILADIEV